MTITRLAPAKVNLALHVTGKRDSGYHELDSLVVFAETGDRLTFETAGGLTLEVTGPYAEGVPADGRNLVVKAAKLFENAPGAAITLEKTLPHAAGIGGGSSDAAAALSALAKLWDRPLPDRAAILGLGADVPVCLEGRPCRMRGIGDRLDPVPDLPSCWIVLANPGVDLPTGRVFAGLADASNPPMAEPDWQGFAGFIGWLCRQRNDLEAPAMAIAPEIARVLDTLNAQPGCALARMSGSGATCFGLFPDAASAKLAAREIGDAHRTWWVAAARVGGAAGVS